VTAVLELTNVQKRYGGDVFALRGLNGVIEGDRIGLLGPNGAGKSTLLKALLGLTPYEGEARVLGLDPRKDSFAIRDRIGYMPETDSYLVGMNGVELCVYAGMLSGLPRAAAMQRAHAALFYANLEDKRYQAVDGYSTGMKQRVKLAQALVHDPELLFLDEPTNGLDPGGRDEMLALIAELPARRGCKVILSSHLLPDIENVCDHIVVLHQGQLQFAGTIEEMRGGATQRWEVRLKEGDQRFAEAIKAAGGTVEPLLRGVAVGLPEGETSGFLFRAAQAAKVQIRHIGPLRASLETAFLDKVKTA
jgi:ABC-2 type transport system ATP-binding protein